MKHKLYVILGASSDVGMAYLKAMEEKETCDVIAHYYHSTSKWEKLLSSCTNIQIHPVQADFSKEEQIEKLISRIEEICDEEICTADILDRCAREACVDVSQLAKTTSEAEWSIDGI